MDFIQELIVFFLIIIPIGAGMRIAACFNYMQMDEDPTPYKKRIRNVLIFLVLAESISGTLYAVLGYFGGTVIS